MKLSVFKNILLMNKDYLFIFIFSFILFLLIQFSSENLLGNDTHLYIKLADIIKNDGLIKEFPWLNATIMKENFTGLHFLYYILLIPFTFLGSLTVAAKVASVFFLSVMFSVFYFILKNLNLKFRYVWLLMLLSGSGYFLLRMNFARPLNFSVIFLLFIFFALIRKNNLLLFITSFLFVWAHGSFPLAVFMAFIFFFVNYFYKRELYYKSIIFSVGGIILANIINPFFPSNLKYFNIYYFNSAPYFITSQIAEWQPIRIDDIIFSDAAILSILFIIFSLTYVFNFIIGIINKTEKIKENNKEEKIILNFLFLISMIFFIGTLFQGRYIDYWVPFSALFIALFFEIIYFDIIKNDKLINLFNKIKFPKFFSKEDLKTTIICLTFIIFGISAVDKINFVLKDSSHSSNEDIKEIALWLKDNTSDKSVVFNVNWGDFSKLFFYNSDNYYILGLDPKFLYLNSPEKYWFYNNIGKGIVCDKEECDKKENEKTIADVIKGEFNAGFVYVPTTYHEFDYTNLINIMGSDSNFKKVFENNGGQIWKLR